MAVFICPKCSETREAPDAYIDRTARCTKCKTEGIITEQISSFQQPKIPKPPSKPPPVRPADAPKRIGTETSSPITSNHIRLVTGLLFAILAVQLIGLTNTIFPATIKTSTIQWEYTIESPSDVLLETTLDRLGGQDWELAFARRATSEYGSPSYEMIFKRPKR